MIIVVMGVSGCGKSTIGARLAQRLNVSFLEGDDVHPAANKQKMSAGVPLTDDDRWPWLDAICAQAHERTPDQGGSVIACSALKRRYRDRLRAGLPNHHLVFVHLTGSAALIQARMQARTDHFMPPGLLESQLATLEPTMHDEHAMTCDISGAIEDLIDGIISALDARFPPHAP